MPAPIATTVGWDMVLSSPRGTITGTWRAGTGSATAFSVSPGSPAIISLSATAGTASDFGVVETRGIFIDASSQELIVDHRESSGLNQSSSTIKSSAYGLGTRFRLGGYNLNGGADGFDYASVYAPFGASVTFEAPVGATLPFWEDSATTTLSVTLAAGETYIARTLPAPICTREIDGALVTSSDPITVDTGGRGNSLLCGLSGTCGDDGADGVLPVSGLGTEYVVVDFPSSAAAGEDVLVVADTANTEVRVNGALVATLGVGGTFVFTLTGAATYVETSHPAYVYQNTGMAGCELDIALIPPVVLAPVGSWSVDFNVPSGFSSQIGVVILSADAASLTLDGTAVTATPTGVPGRPDLAVLAIGTTPGSHTLQGASDFQLGLVTGAGGQAGLFAYYTPFRIPGCGDAVLVAPEGCDDGNLDDGDGCSSSCKIEISFTGCSASGDCVPAGRCDAGTCVARCNGSAECDDSNACTVDACDGTGACTNVAVAAGSAGTCTGGQVCTGAPANRCVQCIADTQCAAPTPHCDLTTNACITCTADAECDDLVECTADVCTAGSCGNTPVVDGLACSTGRCMSGACTTNCGDGIVASGVEACDDGNTTAGDGCSATCAVEGGWSCGCTAPTITYSMEAFAGRMGGDGGGVGPQQGCTGSDVLIGLSIEWSDGRGEAVRTTTICGSVSVSSTGVVSTTPTTRDTEGGSGCFGWDPSTASADVTCPDGWAIVGVSGEDAGGATLFTDLSIVCQQLGPDGSAAGPTMTLHVPGGGSTGSPQMVSCPAGHIARFFQTRRGCGQDALDLFCGVAAADCGGAPSICGTFCGDAVVGAPAETCDDAGESATCDADCTAAMCGDGTVNATAGETCDASGQSPTCDADCTDAVCGDGTQNTMAGESCDDGNTAGGDGCSATCVSETCGDATVQGTETCDDGGESGTCDADCTAATCGDGTRNTTAGEACDDGNATNGDGCSSTCAVETDAGMPDAGRDAGMPDAAMPDAAMPDAAMPMADAGADAGTPDVGIAGGACGCHAAGSGRGRGALGFGLLALATLILRRRSAIRRVGGRS